MRGVIEIPDFVKGKRTRGGRPLPADEMPQPVLVTAVATSVVDRFLGTRDIHERTDHLRRLRDEGVLIHSKDRLTQRVRGQGVDRAYVFRGPAWAVPRAEGGRASRELRIIEL